MGLLLASKVKDPLEQPERDADKDQKAQLDASVFPIELEMKEGKVFAKLLNAQA